MLFCIGARILCLEGWEYLNLEKSNFCVSDINTKLCADGFLLFTENDQPYSAFILCISSECN